MITIFKRKADIPDNMEYVELNDIFFNQKTSGLLDEKAASIIQQIDESALVSKYKIQSKFENIVLDVDHLSTGCKTVLNVLYYPDKVFSLKECGCNALNVLYHLERGYVYCDYALVPFEMDGAMVSEHNETRKIDNYDELKEWWKNEK